MDLHCFGLLEFLKRHNNAFKAQDGIVISSLADKTIIVANRVLNEQWGHENEIFRQYDIDDFKDFAKDTPQLEEYNLMDLLHGEAPVYVYIDAFEMELIFETIDDDTFVYSPADHFYDKTTAFEELQDYIDYLQRNAALLQAVFECRSIYEKARKKDNQC